ncbi:78 kDa glucose-regulated protein-like [Acanthaster planci]|uniref:78 kDa glucose-regulated protein-like n=1 Tax=Acanthaster planci TaxID=133434 RepID=A0A8B7YRZ2_ACAPL|nr:78 kDa glucose-regulated protein-like [Acanthaster planci]XP_022095236.1 78 kDa glucose-regulated protein-like [Acanthaster planci]
MTAGTTAVLLIISICAVSRASSVVSMETDWSTSLVPESFKESDIPGVPDAEPDDAQEEPQIGIYLGYTHSSVAVHQNGTVLVLRDELGNKMVPSCVAFTEGGDVLVGESARRYQIDQPESTMYQAKRLIGRTWDDPEVKKFMERFPIKVVEKEKLPYFEVKVGENKRIISPQEVTSMIISKLRSMAEDFLGTDITEAVIGVPSYFNDQQRQATKEAGTAAGIDVKRLIPESTSAAVAYGLDRMETHRDEVYVLVYDLGTTTLDVSLSVIETGVFEIMAAAHDHDLGGRDINQPVMDYLLDQFQETMGKVLSADSAAMHRLRQEVELSALALTANPHAYIEIESFYEGQDFSQILIKDKYEELTMEKLRLWSQHLVKQVLADYHLPMPQVNVVLAGNALLLRRMQPFLQEMFDSTELTVRADLEDAFVSGLAEIAHSSAKEGDTLCRCSWAPQSVGIETAGGAMHVLLAKDAFLYQEVSDMFTTAMDNQSTVTIKIYEGDRPVAKDNFFLGSFDLSGLQPAPCGVPSINISLLMDVNGRVHVMAKELHSGRVVSFPSDDDARLSCDYRHTDDDSKAATQEDKLVKERLQSLNSLQSYAYTVNRKLRGHEKDLWKTLTSRDKETLTQAVDKTLKWLHDNRQADKDDFDKRRKELWDIVQPITEVYKRSESERNEESKDEF